MRGNGSYPAAVLDATARSLPRIPSPCSGWPVPQPLALHLSPGPPRSSGGVPLKPGHTLVNRPGVSAESPDSPGGSDAGEFEDGVDGGFEGTGVALDLGEEEPALECGEEGDSEVVWVGAVQGMPGAVKAA